MNAKTGEATKEIINQLPIPLPLWDAKKPIAMLNMIHNTKIMVFSFLRKASSAYSMATTRPFLNLIFWPDCP